MMEHNILQHKSQLPTTKHLITVYSVIVLILTLHSTDVLGSTLGAKCQHDMDCTDFIKGSSCSAQGYCECAPYFVQYNSTTCLSSQLLGGDCTLNEQCTMKVANSSCLDGACRCVEGFLQFRKHTCLGPAPPGSVCYSHAHCQMFSTRTHCDFLIPNLFGRCQCTAPAKLTAGLCVDNTIVTPTTTTSTTPQPLKETELPLVSQSTEQEQYVVSTTPSHVVDSVHIENKVHPVYEDVQTDSQENVSIEEQKWEDDRDTTPPTSETPLKNSADPLTPAKVENNSQLEATEAAEAAEADEAPVAIDLPNATQDYPYKIEAEEAHTQTQKPDHFEDFSKETTMSHDEEEDHNEEYGHVIDNTMNFDYEAAQEEIEDHMEMENNEEETELEKHEQHLEDSEKHGLLGHQPQELFVINSDQKQENSQKGESFHEHVTEINAVEEPIEQEKQDEVKQELEQGDEIVFDLEKNTEGMLKLEEQHESEHELPDFKLEQIPEQQHEVHAEQQPEHKQEESYEEEGEHEEQDETIDEVEEHEQQHKVFHEENEPEQQQVHKEQEYEQEHATAYEEKESEQQHSEVHDKQDAEPEGELESQKESEQIITTEAEISEDKETIQEPEPEHQQEGEVNEPEEEHDRDTVNGVEASLQQNLEQEIPVNEAVVQEGNDVSNPELGLEYVPNQETSQHAEPDLEQENYIPDLEDLQAENHEMANEQEHESILAPEQEEHQDLINGQESPHESGSETEELELEHHETSEPIKEPPNSVPAQEILETPQDHYPEEEPHENHELDNKEHQIKDDNYLPAEQQSENAEQSHSDENSMEQQHSEEPEQTAQLDHTNPDSNKLENNLPPKEQAQANQEDESLSELLTLQSIANEIHHDQNFDVDAAENESVQNENEATTQQQIPEAAELQDDEIITTQPPRLEEEEDERNEEPETNNSQEQQQISDAAAKDEILTNNDHHIMDKEEEKMDENNTEGEITDTNTDEQLQEILQEATEEMPELESHTDKFVEDINQHLNEHFEDHQEDEQNQITEISQIDHVSNNDTQHQSALDEDDDNPNKLEQGQEFVTENGLGVETEHLTEKENISQEEISEVESATVMPSHGDKVAELSQNEENNAEQNSFEELDNIKQEIADQAEMADNSKEINSADHIDEQNEIDHLDNQETELLNNQHMYETLNSDNDIAQVAPDKNENSQTEDNHNENDSPKEEEQEESSENETPKLQFIENTNGPSTLSERVDPHDKENEEDSSIESTTLTVQGEMQEEDSTENMEAGEIQEEKETETPSQTNHLLTSNEQITQEPPTAIIPENENDEHKDNISQAHQQEAHEEDILSNIESLETNNVPSKIVENDEELIASSGESTYDNEVIDKEFQEHTTEKDAHNEQQGEQDNKVMPEAVDQAESVEESLDNQPGNTYLMPDHLNDLNKPENQEFKESESISDILNNLMKEDATLQPEYVEESDHMHESDVADLLAEDTNISEESVLSQQLPSKDSTEAPIYPEDKLITFYPDMQELQPVQQTPITSDQELHHKAVEQETFKESPGNEAEEHRLHDNEIPTNEEHLQKEQHHTLSPLDLPFDTSVDYEPQQFEADNLIVETTTLSATDLKSHDIEETVESTTRYGVTHELTTQTMLNLASRVTLMEPAAPVPTTLRPTMSVSASAAVTTVPSLDAPFMEPLLTTKPSTEIRKRVELSLEAVSLGLSCSNSEQCRLADPHTICNGRGVCDCAANVYTPHHQKLAQCGVERTGCAPGTFQCRSSGVCISWFFVCDGRSDCNDASDEECTFNARRNQTCPDQAFQCGQSGKCVSRAALCDGHKQCPQGEDEIGCNGLRAEDSCPGHTFRCKSGECLPEYEFCNAIITCRDGSDEPPHLCGSRSVPNFFLQLLTAGGLMGKSAENNAYCPHRCSNGRCRSTAIVCSGRDGCGDGTDEQTCSVCKCPAINMETPAITVSDYLARHRSMPLW